MKVTLTRYGGLAGGISWPARSVKSDALPGPAAAELEHLVAAIRSEAPLEAKREDRARDSMGYTVTIEEDGGRTTVVKRSDATMSQKFASLIQWLDGASKGSP
ncbi:MAG: hypothetical protein JXB13_13930 [Phycisphaerae bacterium]|nr:hypothetical protein [Phycisphaerae bacterium]